MFAEKGDVVPAVAYAGEYGACPVCCCRSQVVIEIEAVVFLAELCAVDGVGEADFDADLVAAEEGVVSVPEGELLEKKAGGMEYRY